MTEQLYKVLRREGDALISWAEQTAILMRYLAGEEGPFVEEGAP